MPSLPDVNYLSRLPLDAIDPELLGRQTFRQEVIDKSPSVVNDDIVNQPPPDLFVIYLTLNQISYPR
jgi:hypothetical protein